MVAHPDGSMVGRLPDTTVMLTDFVTPSSVAEMDTTADTGTVNVDTMNVAVVAPDGIETVAGTVAAAVLLLDNETVRPPGGAGAARVTVAVAVCPLLMVVGVIARADSQGETVTAAVWLTLFAVAVMVEAAVAVGPAGVMVNVAVVVPWGTVTDAETVAADVLLLVKVTGYPPTPAADEIVTMPVAIVPSVAVPYMVVGDMDRPVGTGDDGAATLK